MAYYNLSKDAVKKGASYNKLINLPVREQIGRFKYVKEEDTGKRFDEIMKELKGSIADLISKGDEYND